MFILIFLKYLLQKVDSSSENSNKIRDFYDKIRIKVLKGVIDKPDFVISVTGGAQKFTVSHQLRRDFIRGIHNAAIIMKSWVITGGTDCGCMKLVGEAVSQSSKKNDLNVIGIATFGVLENKSLKNYNQNTQVFFIEKIRVFKLFSF